MTPMVGMAPVPTAADAPEPEVSSAIRLESPMVGTFYRSPSPAQPAFVDVGDQIEVGQTLCILEAMKLFNEYKSDHAGVIRRILVENAQPVEYGQPLFELEPLSNGCKSSSFHIFAGPGTEHMLTRVLIANRGEAAVRIVRACHDLGIEAVAVYSTADRDGLWVSLADRAVCIGPHQPAQSYLNVSNLVAAAETTGCDSVHPGWGFLAESAAFVRACIDNDLVFVGPSPEALEVMGDKSRARTSMQAAGVPLVPGSTDRLHGADHARTVAADLGYPVLLKAVAGGGGRGMRLVDDPSDIEDAYGMASSEAAAAFGDGGMYVEKALLRPRHVEMQVLADGAGGVLVLGERDCSVQRRHQKLIEEGPSPALDAATRAEMAAAATLACTGSGYRNAGTVEFLLDSDGNFYFIEMNTRLQVEHPVSELLTGVDLACQQILLAGGAALPATGLHPLSGHAIEFRINCEDPARDFRPAAGTVTELRPPLGPRGPLRHPRLLRLPRAAVLRLAARQADRVGHRSHPGPGPRPAGALGAGGRGRHDNPRALPGHRRRADVRLRPLHHRVPRRSPSRPAQSLAEEVVA